jgi:hypothetical protein
VNVAEAIQQKAGTTYVNTQLATKANQAATYTKSETDTLLGAKANQTTTYTKTEADNLLGAKANQTTTYTKTETDNLSGAMANQATTYAETETDNSLAGITTYVNDHLATKANQATTYTKAETDTLLDAKASSTDVALSLATKANQATTYTKTDTDNLLVTKANQTTSYPKTEVNDIAASKQDKFIQGTIPAGAVRLLDAGDTKFRGVAVSAALALASNAEHITITSDTYSKTEVDTKFTDIINSAPDALNTLSEYERTTRIMPPPSPTNWQQKLHKLPPTRRLKWIQP